RYYVKPPLSLSASRTARLEGWIFGGLLIHRGAHGRHVGAHAPGPAASEKADPTGLLLRSPVAATLAATATAVGDGHDRGSDDSWVSSIAIAEVGGRW
ncbi:MAG: hypothetical protein WBM84_04770, partial [Sedimenticolaceae bacterium]